MSPDRLSPPELGLFPEAAAPDPNPEAVSPYLSNVALTAAMAAEGCEAHDLSTPAAALTSVRSILREGSVSTRGRMNNTPDYLARYDALQQACARQADPFIREVSLATVRQFTVVVDKVCTRYLGQQPVGDEQLIDMALLYLGDVRALHQEGIRNAPQLAMYHDSGIVGRVRQACLERLAFRESMVKEFLTGYPRDPVQAVNGVAARVDAFRNDIEPRLRAEYDFQDEWSDSAVTGICFSNLDVEGFFRNRLAARNVLRRAYGDFAPQSIDKMISWSDQEQAKVYKAATIAAREPQRIVIGEADKQQGAKLHTLLLAARGRPDFNPHKHKALDWESLELMRQLHANKEWLYPDWEPDIAKTARFILGSIAHYNNTEARAKGVPAIGTDTQTLCSIFTVHMDNVRQFMDYMGQSEAEYLAGAISAATYEQLIETYRHAIGMTRNQQTSLMRLAIRDPESKLRAAVAIRQRVQALYGDALSDRDLNRTIVAHAADMGRALGVIDLYTADFKDVYPRAQAIHLAITHADAKKIFLLASGSPADRLLDWAQAIATGAEKYSHNPFITYRTLAILMEGRQEATAEERVEWYLERVAHLQRACRARQLVLPDHYLAFWAARSPRKSETALDYHLKVCNAISQCIHGNGETLDTPHALAYLAFTRPVLRKADGTARDFIDRRRSLADDVEGNPLVRQWILDSAATSFNLASARRQLGWLLHIAKDGHTPPHLRIVSASETGQKVDSTAESAFGSVDPASPASKLYEGSLLEQFFAQLPPLEEAAVRCIFGLTSDYDEADLMASLGVDDLEAYTNTHILPKFHSLMGAVTSSA